MITRNGTIAGAAMLVLLVFLLNRNSAAEGEPGAATYKAKCAVCHGAGGKGDTPAGKSMQAPDFTSAAFAGKSEAEIRMAIEKGKNKMPAYGKTLKPEEIQALVALVRNPKKLQ